MDSFDGSEMEAAKARFRVAAQKVVEEAAAGLDARLERLRNALHASLDRDDSAWRCLQRQLLELRSQRIPRLREIEQRFYRHHSWEDFV